VTTDRDLNRVVRSWMDEGVTALPDRVLDSVLAQVPATPQRRPGSWVARRFSTMNTPMKILLAGAAVVATLVIGYNLFGSGTYLGTDPTPTPQPTATVEPTATPVAQLNGQDPLTAGRYQVDPTLPMNVTVEVPDGWTANGAWVIFGPNGNDVPDGMALRFYAAFDVYLNPLSPEEGVISPPVGPSADDLVTAMVDHPEWTTTGTTATTIDGYAGQVVHVTLPDGTSEATPFYFFDGIWAWSPDQIFDIYVVDVGGKRLVIDAFYYPGTSEEDLAAQQAVLDSIQLAP
jgi:hypothetical protein